MKCAIGSGSDGRSILGFLDEKGLLGDEVNSLCLGVISNSLDLIRRVSKGRGFSIN